MCCSQRLAPRFSPGRRLHGQATRAQGARNRRGSWGNHGAMMAMEWAWKGPGRGHVSSQLPCGELTSLWKLQHFGKLITSIAMFNSYVKLPDSTSYSSGYFNWLHSSTSNHKNRGLICSTVLLVCLAPGGATRSGHPM